MTLYSRSSVSHYFRICIEKFLALLSLLLRDVSQNDCHSPQQSPPSIAASGGRRNNRNCLWRRAAFSERLQVVARLKPVQFNSPSASSVWAGARICFNSLHQSLAPQTDGERNPGGGASGGVDMRLSLPSCQSSPALEQGCFFFLPGLNLEKCLHMLRL